MLADWARRIRSWKKQGCDVYVYFDNDQKSAAPADALKLRQLLEGPAKAPSIAAEPIFGPRLNAPLAARSGRRT
jgi:uncharacterized protein YecE (DUF72 family)